MSSLARRLGLDRSPLRRGTDRVEAWIRIALVLVFVIGAPLAGWGAARWAESVAPSAAHAQLAGEHRVTATLLHNVPNNSDYLAPGEPRLGQGTLDRARRFGTDRVHRGAIRQPAAAPCRCGWTRRAS